MPRKRKASRKRPAKRRKGLSQRALAKRLRVSHTAVQKGIASGRLTLPLEVDKSAREWAAGATKAHTAPGAASAPDGPSGPAFVEPGPTSAAPPPVGGTLVSAQLQVAKARATQIRLLNRQRSGRLIEADVARREAYESARSIRDAVLAIPDRVAAELAAESDPARVHARLREELRAALAGVAEALARGA